MVSWGLSLAPLACLSSLLFESFSSPTVLWLLVGGRNKLRDLAGVVGRRAPQWEEVLGLQK